MKWLVTTEGKLDEKLLKAKLGVAGAHVVDEEGPVPLGANEYVWQVEGPQNLDQMLDSENTIKEIFPSSEMTLY